MENMNTLQEAINRRAEAKLEKQIREFIDTLREVHGLRDILGSFYIEVNGKRESLAHALWDTRSIIPRAWIDSRLEDVIKSETQNFLSELSDMKQQLQQLTEISEE
jgi:hypothetical protein